jgi:hypothetical protein
MSSTLGAGFHRRRSHCAWLLVRGESYIFGLFVVPIGWYELPLLGRLDLGVPPMSDVPPPVSMLSNALAVSARSFPDSGCGASAMDNDHFERQRLLCHDFMTLSKDVFAKASDVFAKASDNVRAVYERRVESIAVAAAKAPPIPQDEDGFLSAVRLVYSPSTLVHIAHLSVQYPLSIQSRLDSQ